MHYNFTGRATYAIRKARVSQYCRGGAAKTLPRSFQRAHSLSYEEALSLNLGHKVAFRIYDGMDKQLAALLVKSATITSGVRQTPTTEQWLLDAPNNKKDFRLMIASNEITGRTLGGSYGFFSKTNFDETYFIIDVLAVNPAYRNNGLGSFLIRKMIKLARGMGYKYAVIHCAEEKEDGKSLVDYYSKLGFKLSGPIDRTLVNMVRRIA